MLKVSASVDATGVRLRLDGSLSGKWVEELDREVSHALSQSTHVLLDCKGLSYADPAGLALLHSFAPEVKTVNCSSFLRQQLSTDGDNVPDHQREIEDSQ